MRKPTWKLRTALNAAGIAVLSMSLSTTSLAQKRPKGYPNEISVQTQRNWQSTKVTPAEAEKQWAEVPHLVRQCVNTLVSNEKNEFNLTRVIRGGIPPTHEVIEKQVKVCQALMPAVQKTNFPCTITNSKGQQVATTCEQLYAKSVNGQQVSFTRDDILLAGKNRVRVQLGEFETVAAKSARLAEERRIFEASPEGRRQAAERSAAFKKEEEARRIAEIRRAAEFPYYAVITCGVGYRFIPIVSCLSDDVNTTIEVRNGSDYGNYNIARVANSQIPNSRQTTEGFVIDLRSKFSVKMQNASSSLILGMKVYRRKTNSIVYNKEAQRFGVLAFGI